MLELGGPEIFSMMELNRWIAKAIGRDPLFVEVPDIAAKMLAKGTGGCPARRLPMTSIRCWAATMS